MLTSVTNITSVTEVATSAAVRAQLGLADAVTSLRALVHRSDEARNERGEGVISMAIAVLIMAILGGLMFYAYKAIFTTSSKRVNSIVTDLTNQPITG